MLIKVAVIIVFAIIVFAAFLISLGAILWFMKSRATQPRPAGKIGKASMNEKVHP